MHKRAEDLKANGRCGGFGGSDWLQQRSNGRSSKQTLLGIKAIYNINTTKTP